MPETAPPAADSLPRPHDEAWQALPHRGAALAAASAVFAACLPLLMIGAGMLLNGSIRMRWPWLAIAMPLIAALAGALAYRRYRRLRWRLDAQGLAVRRGHWWQHETRVPASRVQHLDLRRGPLDRLSRLATLVVHTAGTRYGAVAVSGLDEEVAQSLRDRLAHQLDQDDDAL